MHGACKYTPELASIICERLAAGESLRAICRDEGMPPESTVRLWAVDDVQGFAAHYARARSVGLDALAEEALEIANTPVEGIETEQSDKDGFKVKRGDMINHRKLQVDTRKWFLSKLKPEKYGDQARLELTGANGGPVQFSDEQRAARFAAFMSLAAQRPTTPPDEEFPDLV